MQPAVCVLPLTLSRITSYADIRSVATKSNVFSSISKISRTLPDAIFFSPYCSRSTLVTAVDEDMFVFVGLSCSGRVWKLLLSELSQSWDFPECF